MSSNLFIEVQIRAVSNTALLILPCPISLYIIVVYMPILSPQLQKLTPLEPFEFLVNMMDFLDFYKFDVFL